MKTTKGKRVAVLLHGGIKGDHGKTGLAYLRYGDGKVVAVIDQESSQESLAALTGINQEVPIVSSVKEALQYQPEILLIGIAPSGGALPLEWWQELQEAITSGLSIVNGLHTPIAPRVEKLLPGQWIWDIRQEPAALSIGKGEASLLNCERILTVGTDMGVGKMSTSLELNRAAQQRGIKSQFLATGQGGLMISGVGIPLDAVRVDFAAGAVEKMVLEFGKTAQWLIIEGQGSLLHPGSTATLPLLRGSQPTSLILVHRAHQKTIRGLPEFLIPPLTEVVSLYEQVAKAANIVTDVKVKAIALNTKDLKVKDAEKAIEEVYLETGLPCTDPVRFGADLLIEALGN